MYAFNAKKGLSAEDDENYFYEGGVSKGQYVMFMGFRMTNNHHSEYVMRISYTDFDTKKKIEIDPMKESLNIDTCGAFMLAQSLFLREKKISRSQFMCGEPGYFCYLTKETAPELLESINRGLYEKYKISG